MRSTRKCNSIPSHGVTDLIAASIPNAVQAHGLFRRASYERLFCAVQAHGLFPFDFQVRALKSTVAACALQCGGVPCSAAHGTAVQCYAVLRYPVLENAETC
eukprot:6181493-Pleurochrysis_carterae.AAC.1